MKSAFRLFLDSRATQVQKLHSDIRNDMLSVRECVGEDNLTLFDILLLGHKITQLTPEQFKEHRDAVLAALAMGESEMPQVGDLQAFNMPSITSLKAAYRFFDQHFHTRYWQDTILNPDPTPRNLIEISGRMAAPTNVLCLKYFWLYLGFEASRYEGILPHTKPVVTACKLLWGTDFGGMMEATMHQQRVSQETGVCAFDINSSLWLMGLSLKG